MTAIISGVPIDWNAKIREACRLAQSKGLKVESIGKGSGWWISHPNDPERPRVRTAGAVALVAFIENYSPPTS